MPLIYPKCAGVMPVHWLYLPCF